MSDVDPPVTAEEDEWWAEQDAAGRVRDLGFLSAESWTRRARQQSDDRSRRSPGSSAGS